MDELNKSLTSDDFEGKYATADDTIDEMKDADVISSVSSDEYEETVKSSRIRNANKPVVLDAFSKASEEVDSEFFNDEANCENVIEWVRNSKVATITFSQKRYTTKIKRLAEKYPNEVSIIVENSDGSIVAHLPISFIHVSAPKRMSISDERRQELSDRFKKMHADRKGDATADDDNDED